jgi:uncharacterized heparinase superfamily protein
MAVWEAIHRQWMRWRNYFALRIARFADPATAFVSQPEPRSYGLAPCGLQILVGNYLVNGDVVEIPGQSPWDLPQNDEHSAENFHGFGWLDDVAAVGTPVARKTAQTWVFDWIDRFGNGRGPGWDPDVTGRRVVRWINHAILILNHASSAQSRLYFRSLGQQARFLTKRWNSMRAGLPRFEALTGLVYCGLALEGQGHVLPAALRALGRECAREIKPDGGVQSRNPQELMEIFTLLSWVNQAVSAKGSGVGADILLALERMAPAIRALRLGDGMMVRFHGGGSGQAERVDQALADSGIRTPARGTGTMGYSRLSAGKTLVIIDTGLLPTRRTAVNAHACTLGFEMSSGRVPVLVNMGPAQGYSAQLRGAARATGSHNALVVAGASLARFSGDGFVRRIYGERLTDAPSRVNVKRDSNAHGTAILASHDGYSSSHGLTHLRQIAVVHSGNEIQGSDRVYAHTTSEKVRFAKAASRMQRHHSLPIAAHFRVHPDVVVDLDLGGAVVSLVLPNGEVWLFQAQGGSLAVKDAIFIEQGRLHPRATKEVVVSADVVDYDGAISWTLSRPT